MFDLGRVARDFSAAAPQYDAHAGLQRSVLCRLVDKVRPRILPGIFMLDAGCGTGTLARHVQGPRFIQADISYAMCARAKTPHVPSVTARIEALPFGNAVFDIVFSSLVLQWSPDPASALQEMRRVVRPGGTLAFSTLGPLSLQELKDSFTAADGYDHVSAFLPVDEPTHADIVTEYYPDIFALMRHLKALGANNKRLTRRKSMMTPGQMRKVGQRYKERFGAPAGLPVTWEILYSITQKP